MEYSLEYESDDEVIDDEEQVDITSRGKSPIMPLPFIL